MLSLLQHLCVGALLPLGEVGERIVSLLVCALCAAWSVEHRYFWSLRWLWGVALVWRRCSLCVGGVVLLRGECDAFCYVFDVVFCVFWRRIAFLYDFLSAFCKLS